MGEFRKWGLPIAVRLRHPDGFDDFLDAFIAQAIEAHGLAFGGGGQGDRLTGVIEVGTMTDPIEARLQPLRRWLEAREDIEAYVVGPLVDLWHGPFDALEAIAAGLPERSAGLDARWDLHIAALDWDLLAEEVETLHRYESSQSEWHLYVLLMHLWRWAVEPETREEWRSAITSERISLDHVRETSPSLEAECPARLASADEDARRHAAQDTELPVETFPVQCPWARAPLVD